MTTPVGPPLTQFLATHGVKLRMLLNIGSLYGPLQTEAALVASNDPSVSGLLTGLEGVLVEGGVSLVGGASALQPLDFYVASTHDSLLALVAPPAGVLAARFPRYSAWATGVYGSAAYQKAALGAGVAAGGITRAGGQVDIRADPVWVSTRADASVERNAGQKKKETQRAAEDAAKAGAGAAPKAAAPAPKAAAAAAAPPASLPTSQSPETLAANRALPALEPSARMAAALAACGAAGVSVGPVHEHAPAPNVPDLLAALAASGVTGTPCKNLFLKAKKERAPGDSRLWLVVAAASAKTDLNTIGKTLGYAKDSVRFGDEETLKDNLGVVPGHVSPLCLLNDKAGLVNLVLDASLATPGTGPLLFHPFTNTASVEMTFEQLSALVEATGKKPISMTF